VNVDNWSWWWLSSQYCDSSLIAQLLIFWRLRKNYPGKRVHSCCYYAILNCYHPIGKILNKRSSRTSLRFSWWRHQNSGPLLACFCRINQYSVRCYSRWWVFGVHVLETGSQPLAKSTRLKICIYDCKIGHNDLFKMLGIRILELTFFA